MKLKTFIDSGVLIAAARGDNRLSEIALSILDDEKREFASSFFIKLEVLPKAVFHKKHQEIAFYEIFFSSVLHWANDLERITKLAYDEATMFGIASMDAIHVAAAIFLQCDEFVTTERSDKPLHRTKNLRVVSLYDLVGQPYNLHGM